MAGRQEFGGKESGSSNLSKQILGMAAGAALGLLAWHIGAQYFEVRPLKLLGPADLSFTSSAFLCEWGARLDALMKPLVSASILQLSGSSKKPKEVAMRSPPANKEKEASSKPQPSASASKESQQDKPDASQQHDDKDGKNKAKVSPAAEPEEATKSTIVQDEKVPEPGFDAPEDKMQGIEQKFPLPENKIFCNTVFICNASEVRSWR